MFEVVYAEHHSLDLLAYKGIDLPLRGPRLGLVQLVIWFQRYRRAVFHQHVRAESVVVGIVVAAGQNEDFLLEISHFRRIEGHLGIAVGECSEPMLVLMAGFRENHDCTAFQQ